MHKPWCCDTFEGNKTFLGQKDEPVDNPPIIHYHVYLCNYSIFMGV